jgi:hypothetical protein
VLTEILLKRCRNLCQLLKGEGTKLQVLRGTDSWKFTLALKDKEEFAIAGDGNI